MGHPLIGNRRLDDPLGVSEPEVATILPADVKSAEELDFVAYAVIAFHERNYITYLIVEFTSNII